jgi:uncharacterized delta-60 repeat protein
VTRTWLAASLLLLPTLLAAQVDTAWVRRYDGPRHSLEYATCIAVDNSGNVVVAGATRDSFFGDDDFLVIKYYPSGDMAWVRRLDLGGNNIPRGMAVDVQGNTYLTGQGNGRMVTVKYSPTGQLLWSLRRIPEGGGSDLTLDQQGNILACGFELGASRNAVIVKYRSNGDTAWTRSLGTGFDVDARALSLGPESDVCAVGALATGTPGGDLFAISYDSSGGRRWMATYDGPEHGGDWATAAAADMQGSVYVAGCTDSGYATYLDFLTVKYSPAGEALWARRYNGTSDRSDEARAVAVDSTCNAYVSGYADYVDTGHDFATIKYNPDGSVAWLARYDGPAHSGDGAYAIAVDADSRVYVTGSSYDPRTEGDAVTICYTPAGETAWVRRYNSPQNWAEYTTAMCLGPDGSVCVAGIAYDASGLNPDILIIKYTQAGSVRSPQTPAPARPGPSLEAFPAVFRDHVVLCGIGIGGQPILRVFDAVGRQVWSTTAAADAAGRSQVTWNGTDEAGRVVPAGVYTVQVDAGGSVERVRVVKFQ